MTRETLNKMPENVRKAIEDLRKDYKNVALNRDGCRARISGYTKGLRDAGLITEREEQILFIYTTI